MRGVLHDRLARRRNESGAVAIMVGMLAVVLFLLAGIVVDLGLARDTKRQSQNAADAAALAGANALYPDDNALCADGTTAPCIDLAWRAAKDYAERNFSDIDWDKCPPPPADYKVPPGSPSCIAIEDEAKPKKVWAVIPPRVLNTSFGVLAGIETITISTKARAMVGPENNYECGLCVVGVGPHEPGNGDITVSGASIMFNGEYGPGNASGNGVVTATDSGEIISVEESKADKGGTFDPPIIVPGPHVDDPYASLEFPLAGSDQFSGALKTQPCSEGAKHGNVVTPGQGPGIYGDVELSNSTCTLESGLYVILGNWEFKNNTNLIGDEVTLYAACRSGDEPVECTGETTAGRIFGKNGNIDISAPSSGDLRGLAVVYDRLNTAPFDLQGNGDVKIDGNFYAPSSKLSFPGNASFVVDEGRAVVGSVYANGNQGSLTINYVPETVDIPQPIVVRLDR